MITLVTSYINYYRTTIEDSTHEIRLLRFDPIIESKIPLLIYVSSDCLNVVCRHIEKKKEISHIRVIPLKNTFFDSCLIFILSSILKPSLPVDRFEPKDTFDYLCYLNSKVELMNQATITNPFNTENFCWIDFDLSKIWKDKESCLNYLKFINMNDIQTLTVLPPTEKENNIKSEIFNQMYLPGCWEKGSIPIEELSNKVCWRFTGNFLMGNISSIQYLYNLYLEHFEKFIKETNKIVWDMNFFAYLEQEKNWNPIVYKGNHDDSIIEVPLYSFSTRLINKSTKKITYMFPIMFDYEQSSCSYLEYRDEENKIQRHLNIRCVNYKYLDSGHCIVNDERRVTRSKNMYGSLHSSYKNDDFFVEVLEDNEVMKLPSPDENEMFQGIEDLRLYEYNKKIKFVASTVNYSGCARCRVIYGDYVIEKEGPYLKDVSVINPPFISFKEKNWIPFIPKNDVSKEYFIYKWSPFMIGEVINNKLNIVKTYETNFPFKHEVRGSSNILYDNGKYVCIVHVSVENTLPKQYYHMFVYLDKMSYKPYLCSKVYHFDQIGVEFCLSMTLNDNKYVLWISRKDRNPLCIEIPVSEIDMVWEL